ncbi:MAG: DNA-binding response regulator [Proteobacteria bacterium]|nr:MAG: DNA-binding response regulator [Pseudomonadota bacterium]
MKILLLEDELILNKTICEYLKNIGHLVVPFTDGEKAYKSVDESFDLLILDLNTPSIDGFELLEKLNQKRLHIKAIFISASADIDDICKAYELGAKDYLKKPFHLEELGIKINMILKKEQSDTSHIRFSKHYSYSKDKKILYFNKEPQTLSKRQLDIIHTLALNINLVVDYEKFRYSAWDSEDIDNPTIRSEIARLKKNLKEDFIKNIRGLGYKIDRFYSS